MWQSLDLYSEAAFQQAVKAHHTVIDLSKLLKVVPEVIILHLPLQFNLPHQSCLSPITCTLVHKCRKCRKIGPLNAEFFWSCASKLLKLAIQTDGRHRSPAGQLNRQQKEEKKRGGVTVPPTNIFLVRVLPLPAFLGTAALASTRLPSIMCSRCCKQGKESQRVLSGHLECNLVALGVHAKCQHSLLLSLTYVGWSTLRCTVKLVSD